MYNSLGDANFTGKYKGIPLKANSITESLIEIVIGNKKVSFKKGDKIAVTKKVQNIINKILNESESEQKKDNTRIKKFVDSLDLEFKNIQTMPVKKKVTKKAVTKKVAPRKKAVTKKVAPRKKAYERNIEMDSNRRALPKGKRVSKNGIVYYEYRENHADNKQTKKKGQMLGTNDIRLTRINNDVNGNPRYVVHFLEFLNDEENEFLDFSKKYDYALKKAKKIGGKKFHNKQYGGGIVFQSYNTNELKEDIMDIQMSNIK